jgi:hypothetical protein
MDATARRDIVLDGFLGSGTTLIAAERTGRRCLGLELDPLYVDTIVRRWQAFTRNEARHAVSGKSFADIEAEGGECWTRKKLICGTAKKKQKDNYEVGYRKPPRHAQFKKGCSGNARGRPRRSKSANTILKNALLEEVTATMNGQKRTLSKYEAIIIRLVNKALEGDHRAIEYLLAKIPALGKEFAELNQSGGLSEESGQTNSQGSTRTR